MAPMQFKSRRQPRSGTRSLWITLKFINNYEKFRSLVKEFDAMLAESTQGAFRGTRSRNSESRESTERALATPTPHDGGKVPISRSADRPIKLNLTLKHTTIAKPSPRSILKKAASPTKKHVSIKIGDDFYPTPNRTASSSPSPCPSGAVNSRHEIDGDKDMSQESRPKLKLSFSKLNVNKDQSSPLNPSATPSTAATPSLKLKLKQPAPTPDLPPPATPASAIAKTKKKKEKTSSTAGHGGSSSKKRKQPHDEADGASADELAEKSRKKQVKKIRFVQKPQDGPKSATTPQTPFIKLKHKGKIAKRPLGVGYDSELSDREADPTISDAFMFRMPPGPDCELLQHAVENSLIGARKVDGGPEIHMTFFDRHGRRAKLNIEGRLYAATVVDLPCIVEGMKSWDKKGWIKSADISQMFLVLGTAANDEEIKEYPLPPEVDPKTFQYAHGVTPPMQWVRKRRFARTKRTSLSAIEAVERKVNQLLADDAAAESVKWDVIDYDSFTREEYERERSFRQSYDESMDGYEDAEGEEEEDDYFGQENGAADTALVDENIDIDEDEVAAELEAHLMASDEDEDTAEPSDHAIATANGSASATHLTAHALPTTSTSASPSLPTASVTAAASTPAAQTTTTATTSDAEEEPVTAAPSSPSSSSSDEDEDDDEGDDDTNLHGGDGDADADISDEETLAARRELREKIAELTESIKEEEDKFRSMQNPILRKKIQIQIGRLRADLEMARREAGMGDDEDEEQEEEEGRGANGDGETGGRGNEK